ncbi:hypothetical protein TNCV_4435771 [Trichonephila clavipes]|nr:hypothetical protein TNCV_4435771 [Trichonephila clavipes]
MCNYNLTNRAPISNRGPRRNFDTGPPQSLLRSCLKPPQILRASDSLYTLIFKIVRVQYFVRGGFVGHRSRASSKHLPSHLPVDELDSSGGQTGVALHVWVSGPQRSRLDVDVFEK